MFGAGYVLGWMTGHLMQGNHAASAEIGPSEKALERRDTIFNYVKENPFSNTKDIATNLNMEYSDVNGVLMVLLLNGKVGRIKKEEEHRLYYVYYPID